MKDFNVSEFPINGTEVDEYCHAFLDSYGENSEVFQALEASYKNAGSTDGTWCGFLNDLRRRVCEKGFSAEIERQDEIFVRRMSDMFSKINKYSGKTERETRLKVIKDG